jgi:DNA-directed RNA polymerase specialized sigma24 family protein
MRDKQGFAEFAAACAGAVRRQALLLTGQPERAARLAERALADTARHWERLVASGGPAAAEEHARRRLATSTLRRSPRGRRPRPAARLTAGRDGSSRSDLGPVADPGLAAGQRPESDSDATWRALASLPPRRRVVLVLRYDEGLGDEAVGARTGLPAGTVAADAEAGLAALRSILRRRGHPEDLVPAALADPARTPPAPPPVGPDAARYRRRRRLLVAGLAVATAAVAVLVPLAVAGGDGGGVPASTPTGDGQLGWTARGPLAGDARTLRAALRAWQDGVPPGERPSDAAVLYAGRPDGRRLVLLQGTDPRGLVRVAEIAEVGGSLAVLRADPLGRTAPIVAAPAGDGGRVRLLIPAEVAAGGDVLVRDPGIPLDAPLRRLAVDADGLTEPLDPGPGGVPVVVVSGGAKPAVAGSGVVSAGRLTPQSGQVEIAATTLPLGGSAEVTAVSYDDGRLLAERLGGPVVVAPVGPTLSASLVVGRGSSPLDARTYEARRQGSTWLATVIRVGGAPACVYSFRLEPTDGQAALPVVVRRCVPDGSRDGVLHVVADEPVALVRARLLPARGPGARLVTVGPGKPGTRAGDRGFVALVRVSGFPTGPATVDAFDPAGRLLSHTALRPYRR